ncbi:MAG: DMT family transporter [Sinobacteraceae bacterium]|nr:DMT family transporter [Nevskiaceae bacterium]
MTGPPARRPFKAIGLMLLAVIAFAGMDSVLKLFASHYPVLQIAALRGGASLPFLVLLLLLRGRLMELRPVRFPMHLLRAVLMLIVLLGFIYGVRSLSLADAYAIFLAAPLIVTALSVPLLGERVDWRRWTAITIGLIGVVTVLHPSPGHMISLGALATLVASTMYACNQIALRVITRSDTTGSVVFWMIGLVTLFAGLLALPHWVPVRREDWLLLAVLGVFAAIGQQLLTEAFRYAPPSVIAPFEYTALLWGMVADRIIWGVLPTARVYLGGAIIIASGLYLIWRERVFSGTALAAETIGPTSTTP